MLFQPVEEEAALAVVERALELGVRLFDTAPLYGSGLAERRFGRVLAGRPRESLVLATKVGRLIRGGEPVFDFSYEAVQRSLAASLERRRLDRPAPAALVKKARSLAAVCERHGVPLKAAAIQFPFGHPAVTTVLAGSRSVPELDENARLLEWPIPAALWAELKAEHLLDVAVPTP